MRLPTDAICAGVLVLACGLLSSGRASAQTDCSAETAAMEKLGAGVAVSMDVPANLMAGGSFRVSWRTPERFPLRAPAYLVVSIPGDVRFQAPPRVAKPKKADDDLAAPEPELPGFIALPAGARGPLDLAFGRASTRALVPLNQPGSKLSGSFAVRVFGAGTLDAEVRVVTHTSCGEQLVSPDLGRSLSVKPGTPEIVVQDPYDVEQPAQVLIDNSGRYRAHVFEGRYRVYDIATGAKLIDRAGHAPNFSPTARFLVANIGDKGSDAYEVIDLVSREVVATPAAQYIGWVHGDAFMLAGQASYGALTVRPMLISRPVPAPASGDEKAEDGLEMQHPGSCHACRSWTDDNMMLDLDNAILAFTGTFDPDVQPVYELASGMTACCKKAAETAAFLAQNYLVAPFAMQKGWHAREPIRFSQVYDPSAAQEPDPVAKQLSSQLLRHQSVDPKAAPVQAAQLYGATVTRGDWRTHLGRGEDATTLQAPSIAGRITAELSGLGLNAAPAGAREQVPFNNSWISADRSKPGSTEADDKRVEAMIERRTKALEQRLVREVPALRTHLGRRRPFLESPLPVAGLGKGLLYLNETLEGLWRWEINGRPVWLLQLWATEGNGGVGQGRIFLLTGEAGGTTKTGGGITDLSAALETFWSGVYGSSDHQSQIKPHIYLDRYLVMASVAAKTIAVYDLTNKRTITVFADAPQADLLQDVQLSADRRHVLQINSDGQFFIHQIETGLRVLSGRVVDDEIIVYTPLGYYWSSYEGAHFVQLRFPGLSGLYPFKQFASVLERPDIIRAALKPEINDPPPPQLLPPPLLDVSTAKRLPEGDQLKLRIHARSTAPLARLGLYADGLLIAQRELSGTSVDLDIEVPRPRSARWLTAQVVDGGGLVSTPQAIRLEVKSAPTSALRAVLVGINNYPDPKLHLKYARQDAERLGAALESTAGHYYARADVTRLLDLEASKAGILAALARSVRAAAPEDTIVFSFAGHGLQNLDGRYYLTTSDFEINQIASTALAWTEIAAVLHQAKSRVIVILDACHAGLSGSEGLGTNDDAVGALLSGIHPPMLVLAASKGRQESYESPKWEGGVFTFALVEALQRKRVTYDLDHNGAIEASELYRAVKSIVVRETQSQQTPWLVRQDLLGDFAVF